MLNVKTIIEPMLYIAKVQQVISPKTTADGCCFLKTWTLRLQQITHNKHRKSMKAETSRQIPYKAKVCFVFEITHS